MIREAAFKGALSEADRVFGRFVTPVLVAAPVLNGIPQNTDPQLLVLQPGFVRCLGTEVLSHDACKRCSSLGRSVG
jgi:hypothetical protein